jgi:hypothetical protein
MQIDSMLKAVTKSKVSFELNFMTAKLQEARETDSEGSATSLEEIVNLKTMLKIVIDNGNAFGAFECLYKIL